MGEVFLRKYATTAIVDFSLYDVNGVDFKVDAAHAAGDTVIMKDEGAEANTGNAFVDEGTGYSQEYTTAEMTCKRAKVYCVDQGAKAWIDTGWTIETWGHADAQHPGLYEAKAELAAVPAAAAATNDDIKFLAMALRNSGTDTAATHIVNIDAGTRLASCAISDDGTTFTRGKMAT